MDGLDLLKKDWNKEGNFPKISESEIYKMIHKKSSSIVKWIFIISVLEILLWVIMSIFLSDEGQKDTLVELHLDTFFNVYTVVHWGVLLIFVFLFYKNFKMISNTSSAKSLMSSILKVRKIVTWYVWYNLIGVTLTMIIMYYFSMIYDQRMVDLFNKVSVDNKFGFIIGYLFVSVITIALIVGLIWLFYRIIYGILLRRLKSNYEELRKLEI